MKRIKRIRSHTGHAQFLATGVLVDFNGEARTFGYIPRTDIPSPYAYSPTHVVYRTDTEAQLYVIIVETSHRCFDVFAVPVEDTIYANERAAEVVNSLDE